MKHNSYVNGKVQNIEYSSEGMFYSVGVVYAGSYEFTTEYSETIKCITGCLYIDNVTCSPGEHVVIPAKTKFTIQAKVPSSYLCTYGKK